MLTHEVPVLPSVATSSEVVAVLESGLDSMKFIPAGSAGGPSYLPAIGAPIPYVQFCPACGISLANAPEYLRLPNVSCVGGSWLTPTAVVEAKDWSKIISLARQATALSNKWSES